MTRFLATSPQDEFVLNPEDHIAFDFFVPLQLPDESRRWLIHLRPTVYDVRFVYEVQPEQTRYDYLGKGSLFADRTPPWTGVMESNIVRVAVT